MTPALKILRALLALPDDSRRKSVRAWQDYLDYLLAEPLRERKQQLEAEAADTLAAFLARGRLPAASAESVEVDVAANAVDTDLHLRLTLAETFMLIDVADQWDDPRWGKLAPAERIEDMVKLLSTLLAPAQEPWPE